MSGRLVGEVLNHAPEDLRPAEFLTLIVIAEDARDKDRCAPFSDLESIVQKTRLKPGTVKNALTKLRERGLIITSGRAYIGRHQEYKLAKLGPEHRTATAHLTRIK